MRTYAEIARDLMAGRSARPEETKEMQQRMRGNHLRDGVHHLLRAYALSVSPTDMDVELVAAYLSDEASDIDRQGAIYALCNYWRLTDHFVPRLLELTAPDMWDANPDSALAALSALGQHAHAAQDVDVLRVLYERLNVQLARADLGGDAIYAEALHSALDFAVNGRDSQKRSYSLRLPRDLDLELLAAARRRLAGVR